MALDVSQPQVTEPIILAAPHADLRAHLDLIRGITNELFGGECSLSVEPDPEVERMSSLVVRTTTQLEPAQAVRMRLEWHRRVYAILGGTHNPSLAIDIV